MRMRRREEGWGGDRGRGEGGEGKEKKINK